MEVQKGSTPVKTDEGAEAAVEVAVGIVVRVGSGGEATKGMGKGETVVLSSDGF